jgi:signal transduction histidine kinase
LRQRHNEEVNKIMNEQEIVLLAATIDAQQNERKKLAKDIHDNLGSYLATLKYQHETLESDVNDPDLRAHHAVTAQLIEEAFAEVRAVSHQMATGLSMSFSFIPAIRELIERIRLTRQFVIEMYAYPQEFDIPGDKALHLYKIVQELLSNILKHARANHVSVNIHYDIGEINLMMEDDGVGFVPAAMVSGIGLTNIRERMQQLQGELEINSLPGKGTTVLLIVPIYPDNHDSYTHS